MFWKIDNRHFFSSSFSDAVKCREKYYGYELRGSWEYSNQQMLDLLLNFLSKITDLKYGPIKRSFPFYTTINPLWRIRSVETKKELIKWMQWPKWARNWWEIIILHQIDRACVFFMEFFTRCWTVRLNYLLEFVRKTNAEIKNSVAHFTNSENVILWSCGPGRLRKKTNSRVFKN